jgi:hypothetical protein
MTTWRPQPDGEYFEHTARVNGHDVTIYADRDGQRWGCFLDEQEHALEASTLEAAQAEAERLAQEG